MSQTFDQFQALYSRIRHLNRAATLMSWDLYTATPKNGYQDMSDTLTYFSSESFSLSTSDEFRALLTSLSQPEELNALSEGMQYTVKKLKKQMEKNSRIPKDFYEELISLHWRSSQEEYFCRCLFAMQMGTGCALSMHCLPRAQLCV